MSESGKPSKSGRPAIVISNNALKLAEQWVSSMTKSAEDKPAEKAEGRPPKLGLGATVPCQSNPMLEISDNPIARKLHSKLNTEKRKKNLEVTNQTDKNVIDDDVDSDDDMESRTNAFPKKRTVPSNAKLPANKKRK